MTTPDARTPKAPSATTKKKNFCPALYFPVSARCSSIFVRRLGPTQDFSSFVIFMSFFQSKNMTRTARKNAQPNHGWRTRHTGSPPKNVDIHAKTGVQIGKPVKRQRKNVSATDQWMTREESLCRTTASPTTTSS